MGKIVAYAPKAWNLLQGVMCVYKPEDMSCQFLRKVIIGNLCRDLNLLHPRPPTPLVAIEGSVSEGLVVVKKENYADHPLVLGPHYQPNDFRLSYVQYLHKTVSGVCVIGLNGGSWRTNEVRSGRLIRTYTLSGQLGRATDTHYKDGKVLEKSRYGHVTRGKLQRALMATQAGHQRSALSFLGLNPHSQEAYEALAADGLVRPGENSPPLVYGLTIIDFNPPHFTIEVSCINETGEYMHKLIHDLGLTLKTNAVCTQVRCIRYGPWTLSHALLRKHWTLENIVNNILMCDPMAKDITPKGPSLVNMEETYMNSEKDAASS